MITVRSVDVVDNKDTIDLVASIDVNGMVLEETLALPRHSVQWLADQLEPFLSGDEDKLQPSHEGQDYQIWTPDRAIEPVVCIMNLTMQPDPPRKIKAKVTIALSQLAATIVALRKIAATTAT